MRNRPFTYVLAVITASLLLTGCSQGFSDWLADKLYNTTSDTEPAELQVTVVPIIPGPETTGEQTIPEVQSQTAEAEPLITVVNEAAEEEKEYESIPEAGIEETAKEQTDSYAYSMLNSEEQRLYLEILTILSQMSHDITISSKDTEQIDKVFRCVMLDHPEIFYVQGYSMTKLTRGGVLSKITMSGTYSMSQADMQEKARQADAAATAILNQMNPGAQEYDRVKFVYEYLVRNTEYDVTSEQNQNILSVLLNGRSVCQGYAKTAQYLLNRCGIFCTLAEGVVKGSEPHVWNIVRIDGNYYNMDVTWGDASYNITGTDSHAGQEVPDINYDYLNVPDSMLRSSHVVRTVIPLPACNAMDANYYVREGIYFTGFDENQLAGLFAGAYARGDKTVQIKCADLNVYQAFYQHLITDEKIFDYLNGSGSVRYIEMREQLSMMFYL